MLEIYFGHRNGCRGIIPHTCPPREIFCLSPRLTSLYSPPVHCPFSSRVFVAVTFLGSKRFGLCFTDLRVFKGSTVKGLGGWAGGGGEWRRLLCPFICFHFSSTHGSTPISVFALGPEYLKPAYTGIICDTIRGQREVT